MVLQNIGSVDVKNVSVAKSKDNNYIQIGLNPAELQSEWLVLGKYPLPSEKYIADDTKSINLKIPIERESETFLFFDMLDNYLFSKHLMKGKTLHKFVKMEEGDKFYLKVKLYNDTGVFIEKEKQEIHNLNDFRKYLTEGTKVRLVIGFTKQWIMGSQYGFSISVKRLQAIPNENVEEKVELTEFIDEN